MRGSESAASLWDIYESLVLVGRNDIQMMTHSNLSLLIAAIALLATVSVQAVAGQAGSELYSKGTSDTRWVSFENPDGAKGQGGKENSGAKGHAFDSLPAGRSVTLLDVKGCGIIRRMWITMIDRSPQMLRGLRVEMYWDNAKRPAVSVPFGDFFGIGLGKTVPLENELFANPTGASFVCYIPMPFRKAARVAITNESGKNLTHLFYDIDYNLIGKLDDDALYFHACWRRENPTVLGRDFEILPLVKGDGRFLGSNVGVIESGRYAGAWWGEGAVKVYLDGDKEHPTLVGTGTEDYFGGAWGPSVFAGRYQGCLFAQGNQCAFYRYHVPDPIYFHRDCRVTLQQMGGAGKQDVLALKNSGVPLQMVGGDGGKGEGTVKLLEMADQSDANLPDNFVFFYRQDDVSATGYFYLDSPEGQFPAIAPCIDRAVGN